MRFDLSSGRRDRCDKCLNVGICYRKPVVKATEQDSLLAETVPESISFDVELWCAGCLEVEHGEKVLP